MKTNGLEHFCVGIVSDFNFRWIGGLSGFLIRGGLFPWGGELYFS